MKQTLILALLLSLAACSDSSVAPNSKENTGAQKPIDDYAIKKLIRVTDFRGKEITLESQANRIVALAPHIVENVYSAGAGSKLVGVVAYSNFPESAKSLPLVGGYAKTNLEKIVELNPDLIIAWQSGNSEASVSRLEDLGFDVYLDQPETLEDIAKSIRDIGVLSGTTEIASSIADSFLHEIGLLENKYKTAKKLSTFYQVWNQPLQTINRESIISDAIKLCGGINIYADEPVIAPIINIESILQRNPDAIIASGMSDKRPDWLDDWKKWDSLAAVKQNNLFFVNPDHIQRHTVRLLLGINTICQQLEQARKPMPNL